MKKIKINKEQLKIVGYISGITAAALLSFNFYLVNDLENKLEKFKTIKGPDGSFFQGMESSFSDVTCSGFFSDFECELSEPKIIISNGAEKKDLFIAEKAVLNNISNTNDPNINFDISLKNLTLDKDSMHALFSFYESQKQSKEKIERFKKDFLPIDGNFKLNLKYLGENKNKKREYKGLFSWSIDNNLLKYSSEVGFFMSEGGTPLSFTHPLLDKEDNVAQPVSRVEIKDQRFSRIDYIYTNFERKKEIIPFLYNIYYLLLFNKPDQNIGFMNNQYLGVGIERLFTEKEFKFFVLERLTDASKSAKDINDTFSMNYYNSIKEILNTNKKSISIEAINKSGVSVQEIEIINQIQDFVDPKVINEKQFKTKIEVN